MCLEIYHPDVPLQIEYEHEQIIFTDPFTFKSRYIFLIRNGGHLPIESLLMIYPRSLFAQPEGTKVNWQNPVDITDLLAKDPKFQQISPESLLLLQPDPNRPQFNRELRGRQLPPSSLKFQLPPKIDADHVSILRGIPATCLQIDLGDYPLEKQESRWFWWEIPATHAGVNLAPTILGRQAVLHKIASPIDVRRTIFEMIEAGLRESEEMGDIYIGGLCATLLDSLGLRYDRRVDIQYYELAIWPGPAARRMIVSWHMERDLRMRSDSPRLGEDPSREPVGEPIFEWKSGTLLLPDHSWKDEGFILHLTMIHDEMAR